MPDPAPVRGSDTGRNDPRLRLAGPALAALILSAVTSITPITQGFEGFSGKAYRDPVGILTQCYGETANVDPSLIYSKDQCATKLRARMRVTFAPALAQCVPDFRNPRNVNAFEAAIDASYNAGPRAVCRSPMAAAFRAGRWDQGCRSFPNWYVTARHKYLRGLGIRRGVEMHICELGENRA